MVLYKLIDVRDGIIRQNFFMGMQDLVSDSAIDLNREDKNMILTATRELFDSMMMFKRNNGRPRVSMYGTARSKPGTPEYQMAYELAGKFSEHGYDVIGGGGPGDMAAFSKGGKEHTRAFGLGIEVPWEQEFNEFLSDVPTKIQFHYFFTRKVAFLKNGDVHVGMPGGFGTQDEVPEAITMMQCGKAPIAPIILAEPKSSDYWQSWLGFIKKSLLDKHYISPEDLNLIFYTNSVDEAVAHADQFYKNFQSVDYKDKVTTLKLKKPLIEEQVKSLISKYIAILDPRELQSVSMSTEPDKKGWYDFQIPFIKRNFGTLRLLIDDINKF